MGNEQLLLKGYRGSLWETEKVLPVNGDDGCTAMCMYVPSAMFKW